MLLNYHTKSAHKNQGSSRGSRKARAHRLINRDDFFFVVCSAFLTYSVGHHQRAALATFHQCRSSHFPVCSSLISSAPGRFVFRTNRHRHTSLSASKISLIAAILGSGTKLSQSHVPVFRSLPHVGQIPLQSGLHRIFIGQLVTISLFSQSSTSN